MVCLHVPLKATFLSKGNVLAVRVALFAIDKLFGDRLPFSRHIEGTVVDVDGGEKEERGEGSDGGWKVYKG